MKRHCPKNTRRPKPVHDQYSHKPSVVLYASREAPIGWLNLTLFDDSTFVANSLGTRGDGEYGGIYLRQYDTVFLYYTSEEPRAFGRQLLINRGRVDFIDITQTLAIDSLTLNFDSLMIAKSKYQASLSLMHRLQGDWVSAADERWSVHIQNDLWTDLYDRSYSKNEDVYRIDAIYDSARISQELNPGMINGLALSNQNDTLLYDYLGSSDSTLSLMHRSSGQNHFFIRSKKVLITNSL